MDMGELLDRAGDEAASEEVNYETQKKELAMLRKLEGAIAKKKRKKSGSTCAAEQVVRRNKIQPLIIHSVSPPLIQAEPSTFMRIVQRLTGSDETRVRCEEEVEAASVIREGSRVGSPCSSTTSTTTATTLSSTLSDDLVLNYNAGLVKNAQWCNIKESSFQELIAENEDAYVECSTRELEPISSTSSSTCSLLLGSDQHIFFNSEASASADEHLFDADSNIPLIMHPQDLESTLDSYLEHLLSSYDRDAYCKFTCTSSLLSDVCDPLLLKEML